MWDIETVASQAPIVRRSHPRTIKESPDECGTLRRLLVEHSLSGIPTPQTRKSKSGLLWDIEAHLLTPTVEQDKV
jgi:hypothetical protein